MPIVSRVAFLLTYLYLMVVVGINLAMGVKSSQREYPVLAASLGLAVSVGLFVREESLGGRFLGTGQHLNSFVFMTLMLLPRVRSKLRERKGDLERRITCPGSPARLLDAGSTCSEAQSGRSRDQVAMPPPPGNMRLKSWGSV